jgi:hypothetical protein
MAGETVPELEHLCSGAVLWQAEDQPEIIDP